MVTLRKRARTQETPANPKQSIQETSANPQELTQEDHQTKIHESSGCEYEESRAKRIKENMKRMQQLGILDLSLKLKAQLVPPKRSNQRKPPRPSPLASPSLPPRRSSRLQTVTPISYSEIPEKKGKSLKDEGPLVGEGHKPEVYTEEHEKLLGTCEGSWTLFVDGYGKDGKRIYDPVNGKTCHQCRQKTMGHRTHCSECNLVQGQFCGDCLYMRYGEHVLEAKENPNWICPGCRGICNCSLCRQAKGWPATGMLYRKISALGFKSVAHYLIQTRRVDQTTSSGGDSSINLPDSAKEEVRVEKEESQENTYLPVSAKRSLTFKEEMSEDQNHGFEDKTEKLRGEEAEVVGAT